MNFWKPKLVTFDCAQTILQVDWHAGRLAAECFEEMGFCLEAGAQDRYQVVLRKHMVDFHQANLTRDEESVAEVWRDIGREWLESEGFDPSLASPLYENCIREGFSVPSRLFSEFSDVRPCLERLQAQGIRCAVISNWDVSLHRVLQMFSLTDKFEFALASLEEGVEKPDPKLFEIAMKKANVTAAELLHIGDDPTDDMGGAKAIGARYALIDRSRMNSTPPYLKSLNDVELAFSWGRS